MKINVEIQQSFSNLNSAIYKKDNILCPSGYLLRMQNIQKSISVIHHINKPQTRNYMTILIGAERVFDKIQHAFLIKKNSQKTRNRRVLPQSNIEHLQNKTNKQKPQPNKKRTYNYNDAYC